MNAATADSGRAFADALAHLLPQLGFAAERGMLKRDTLEAIKNLHWPEKMEGSLLHNLVREFKPIPFQFFSSEGWSSYLLIGAILLLVTMVPLLLVFFRHRGSTRTSRAISYPGWRTILLAEISLLPGMFALSFQRGYLGFTWLLLSLLAGIMISILFSLRQKGKSGKFHLKNVLSRKVTMRRSQGYERLCKTSVVI